MSEKQSAFVRVDIKSRERLRALAEANRRSMTQQLAWMIDRAWEEFLRSGKPEALQARGEGEEKAGIAS